MTITALPTATTSAESTITVELDYDLDHPADLRIVAGQPVLRVRPDMDPTELGTFVLLAGRGLTGAQR